MKDIMNMGNEELTMSSVEIAELTGKRHADVMRDIRKMLEELEIGERNFASTYLSRQDKELPCFNLPKRETELLIMGYSRKMQAAVYDRMRKLEAEKVNQAFNIPSNLPDALQLAADLAKESAEKSSLIQKQETQLEQQQPKVDALTQLMEAGGSHTCTVSAKCLQVKPSVLFQWLFNKGWIYRSCDGGPWVGNQKYINAEYITHKVHVYASGVLGDKTSSQVRVTSKGLGKIATTMKKEEEALSEIVDAHQLKLVG